METRAIGAALAATGLLLLAAMPVTSLAQDDRDQTRFTLVERADTDVVVDLGEDGDSLGDLLVFGNELYDEANETVVGRDQGSCVRTNPRMAWECTWTNLLDDGSLVVQGPFYDDLRDSVLAVTGGTGAYAGAEGTMTLRSLDDAGTELEFTFELSDDDRGDDDPDATEDPDGDDGPDDTDDPGDDDDDD